MSVVVFVGWSRVELEDRTLAQVLGGGAAVGGYVLAGTFVLIRQPRSRHRPHGRRTVSGVGHSGRVR
ncbi:hypothetical protein [Streptomyces sp. AP-93]|uniref:hypothetical protein n=1 Tax=Streptomyces sp. AP-93 TaxID=2929048 RepID=UPI001FAEDAAC|nr:hypothetical protein [Streptomyces sp. AP-93]MCJ0872123.1 hypothetical protein [Streptomyces sp. AP-93]